jgi:hypothetical protein
VVDFNLSHEQRIFKAHRPLSQPINLPLSTPAAMAAAVASSPQIDANSAQVDLSTIPISPAGGNTDENAKPSAEAGEEQITVFHDKDNFNVKHPLMHKWTLWFTKPPSGKVCPENDHAAINMLTSY